MKKRVDAEEKIVLTIIAVILGMTAITLFSAWVMNRTPEVPGTGISGETIELREATIRFVRENEALLQRAVQELKILPKDTHEVFYHNVAKEYIANNGTHHTLENQFLIDLLEDTVVDYIDRENGSWMFHLEYGEDSLFESKCYFIVHSEKDPSADLYDSGIWNEQGSGKSAHWQTGNGEPPDRHLGRKSDLYLEEIGNNFWYFYEYST